MTLVTWSIGESRGQALLSRAAAAHLVLTLKAHGYQFDARPC